MNQRAEVGDLAVTVLLDAVDETGDGPAFSPLQVRRVFQFEITDTATARLEVRLSEDASWIALPGSTLTASGIIVTNEPYPFIRAAVTAHTSGTVSVWMST